MDPFTKFRRQDIGARQVDTLIGLCKGIVADGRVDQAEAEFLHSWLIANQAAVNENPMIGRLMERVGAMLEDEILDDEEEIELLATLQAFSGEESEVGEMIKTSSLPMDDPAPVVSFYGRTFLFTGTFASGTREQCKTILTEAGGEYVPRVTRKLDYLVIGGYATTSWKHETFGRKIELAMKYREDRGKPAIISEDYWVEVVTEAIS